MSAMSGSIAARPHWSGSIFDKPSLLFAAAAVVIPNLPALIASIYVCPRRLPAIALYLFIGFMSRRVSPRLTITMFVLAVLVDVLFVVADVFKLEPSLVVQSIKYVVALDPLASITYLAVFFLVLANTIVGAMLLTRYRSTMRQASMVPAVLAFLAVIAVDLSANRLTEYKFGALLGNITPFESAMGRSGQARDLATAGYNRNLLIVMVEGMGAFNDPAHKAILSDLFNDDKLLERYEVTEGTSSYVGSTTGGESRELCGSWGDFRDYLDKPSYDCLPAALAAKGYETVSFHAFSQDFFERADWYPRIGFQQLNFMEQMAPDQESQPQPLCGLTWRGLCDLDVADRVESFLTRPGDQSRFAYWLTLNSHMPINQEDVKPRLDCQDGGPFGDTTVCKMTEMWMDVFDRVRLLALNPALARTDILVIGDHHPPVWTRHGRAQFLPGKVSWYRLSPR